MLTVLIAPAEHLSVLKYRDDLVDALAFSDSDALRALEAITRQRPGVVALERLFAATSRGAALINRIRADPQLGACEIRIIAHDTAYSRTPVRSADTQAAPVALEEPAPAAGDEFPPGAQIDEHGTRRAPRYDMMAGMDVQVDGNPATLLDLSIVGAQVSLPTILRPNQRVRLSLPQAGRAIRVSGSIAWAKFEIPKEGPRYRAGIEFFGADTEGILRFITQHRRK